MTKPLTVCALFYGDHIQLAERCLTSIEQSLDAGCEHVEEFRFGMNAISARVRNYVHDFCHRVADNHSIPSHTLYAWDNALKYPMMRRLFYRSPLHTEYVMWFDDDSYFEPNRDKKWWRDMLTAARNHDMIGQFWLMPVQGNQLEWITTQPWFNAQAGPPPKKTPRGVLAFEFCQGAWWVIRSRVLQDLDWPVPEIRHNGGDSMLGEALRHCGYRMGRFYGGVRINADVKGAHSKSKRRGLSENRVGWDYRPGTAPDLSFQKFDIIVVTIPATEKA